MDGGRRWVMLFFLKRAGKGLVSLSLSLFRGRRMEIEVLFQKIKDTGKKSTFCATTLVSFLFLLPPSNQRQNKTTMPLQISSLSADFKTRASSPYIVFECEGVRAQTKAIKVERLRNSLWSFSFFCFFRGRRRRRAGERASERGKTVFLASRRKSRTSCPATPQRCPFSAEGACLTRCWGQRGTEIGATRGKNYLKRSLLTPVLVARLVFSLSSFFSPSTRSTSLSPPSPPLAPSH